jgi:hypothetical protein
MALVPSPVSHVLMVGVFVAVASSAGLQWLGLSAQAEAVRQQASRQTLTDFSSLLHRFETATKREKPAVAEHLVGMAERLSRQVKGEALASASRRVGALASYEAETQVRDKELQERLRAEVRGLMNEAESLESAALGQATLFGVVNQILLVLAALLCGLAAIRARRANLEA